MMVGADMESADTAAPIVASGKREAAGNVRPAWLLSIPVRVPYRLFARFAWRLGSLA